jgi:choloylglycine hydrolase
MRLLRLPFLCLAAGLFAAVAVPGAHACSRVVAATPNATAVAVGRTMDWRQAQDTRPTIQASPVGLARTGGAGQASLNWTARHGSVCTSFMGILPSCADGVNTAGLSVGLLYLPEAAMPTLDGLANSSSVRAVNITVWAQYVLDTYASVAELVADLASSPQPYTVATFALPDGTPGVGHMMATDAAGASAVIEPVEGGGLKVFTTGPGSGRLAVMTNGPTYSDMVALDEAADEAGAIPAASSRSVDRFQRATWWLDHVTVPADPAGAFAAARSIMGTLSTPLGAVDLPGKPEASVTQWTSTIDATRGLYALEVAARWPAGATVVPLASLGLDQPATPVRVLDMAAGAPIGTVGPTAFKEVAGPVPGVVAAARDPSTTA